MGYSIVWITEKGREDWESEIREKLDEQLAACRIPGTLLNHSHDPAPLLQKGESAIAVYLAGSPSSIKSSWNQFRAKLPEFLPHTCMVPVTEPGTSIPDSVPNEMHRFNGVELGHN